MRFHDRKKATRATPVGGVAPAVLKASSSSLQHAVGARSLPYSRSRIVSATRQLVHHVGSRLGGLLSRSFKKEPLEVARAEGHWYFREDGSMFYDASCGASVSHFGPGPHARIIAAARAQEDKVSYVCGTSLTTKVAKEYADALLRTTDGVMKDAVFYGSGSDAIEAGYKLAIQYFAIIGQPNRRLFIARKQSYHGTTLTALSIGGHNARREDFKNVLVETHHVSPCNPYRDMKEGETNEMYVLRLQEELRQKFRDLGPENVAAFILEPIVGAALGCMPSLPGYMRAMEDVCREYGALFIVDEVMCGLGRCGKLHAWQGENVTPDIQLMGKGLAGGYRELSAMLVGGAKEPLFDVFYAHNKSFNNGHTFQNSPVACAAGLEVLKVIQEQDLIKNVQQMGALLKQRLVARLGCHPNVGDIRGGGLFIGIEFVRDRCTKESFKAADAVSLSIHELGLTAGHDVHIYPGSGCNGGTAGDHIIVSPAYDIDEKEVDLIVDKVGHLIEDFFATFKPSIESL